MPVTKVVINKLWNVKIYHDEGYLDPELRNKMIENVIYYKEDSEFINLIKQLKLGIQIHTEVIENIAVNKSWFEHI